EVHLVATGQIAPVALDAHAALRLAGEHAPDADLLDARVLHLGDELLVDLLVLLDEHLVGDRIADVVERDAAEDALAERLDDLARRLRHETAHAGELADLLRAASRAGVRHHVDRVERRDALRLRFPVRLARDLDARDLEHHLARDLLGHLGPDVDDLVVALAV